MSYDVQGTFYEACDCEIICSCWAGIDPEMGQCTGLWAWEIDQLVADTEKKKLQIADGVDVRGCKVVVLSNGSSCDDAINKLVIIDVRNASNKAAAYTALGEALIKMDGAWLQVFDQTVKTINTGVIEANIDISSVKGVANISVSEPINNASAKVKHAISNNGFATEKGEATTQITGTSRMVKAVLGEYANSPSVTDKLIDVGHAAQLNGDGLNLLAEVLPDTTKGTLGYTFDLDIVRASAARGKFHYVHTDQQP